MTYEELIAKAKEAESVQELLAMAKENGMDITEEDAGVYYAQLHKTGELADDELDNVSGGGCKTSGGQTVVSAGKPCFTDQFCMNWYWDDNGTMCSIRKDNVALRKLWGYTVNNLVTDMMREEEFCGNCQHLEFKGGTGYCGKT